MVKSRGVHKSDKIFFWQIWQSYFKLSEFVKGWNKLKPLITKLIFLESFLRNLKNKKIIIDLIYETLL